MEIWHLALALAGMLVTAGAVYGGIRADLRNMKERQHEHDQALKAIQTEGCGPCRGRRFTDQH